MPYDPLTKNLLTRALRRLGELAQDEGLELELSLYGGAVFTLVYESRDATRDVDGVIHPAEAGQRLADRVAKELGLPDDWLNDKVRFFLAEKESKRRLSDAKFGPGLRISVPTASYLLALKLRAFRSPLPGYAGDHDDIRFLLEKMNLKTVEEAEAVFDRFFPHDGLTDSHRLALEKLLKKPKQP